MNPSFRRPCSVSVLTGLVRRCALGLTLIAGTGLAMNSLSAQTEAAPPAEPAPTVVAPPPPPAPEAAPTDRRSRRGNFDPAAMQARMLGALRTQLVVPDDGEWSIISERILKVFELRRSTIMGGFGGFGGRGGRFGAPEDPAAEALKQAITDNLPDAEIKARLAKVREARKQAEANLDKAREDLRSVLSVRQEAVAVMTGLLN